MTDVTAPPENRRAVESETVWCNGAELESLFVDFYKTE